MGSILNKIVEQSIKESRVYWGEINLSNLLFLHFIEYFYFLVKKIEKIAL